MSLMSRNVYQSTTGARILKPKPEMNNVDFTVEFPKVISLISMIIFIINWNTIKRVSSVATYAIHVQKTPAPFSITNINSEHIHITHMKNMQPAITFFRFTIHSHPIMPRIHRPTKR